MKNFIFQIKATLLRHKFALRFAIITVVLYWLSSICLTQCGKYEIKKSEEHFTSRIDEIFKGHDTIACSYGRIIGQNIKVIYDIKDTIQRNSISIDTIYQKIISINDTVDKYMVFIKTDKEHILMKIMALSEIKLTKDQKISPYNIIDLNENQIIESYHSFLRDASIKLIRDSLNYVDDTSDFIFNQLAEIESKYIFWGKANYDKIDILEKEYFEKQIDIATILSTCSSSVNSQSLLMILKKSIIRNKYFKYNLVAFLFSFLLALAIIVSMKYKPEWFYKTRTTPEALSRKKAEKEEPKKKEDKSKKDKKKRGKEN